MSKEGGGEGWGVFRKLRYKEAQSKIELKVGGRTE